MKNIKKIEVKGGYLMPEERACVGTVDQAIIEKVNEIIETINKPVETTNEQPKVIFPNLRRCFMSEGMISCPIISGSVQSSGYDTPVIIDVRTDHPQNRTTITLNLDGTYTIGW